MEVVRYEGKTQTVSRGSRPPFTEHEELLIEHGDQARDDMARIGAPAEGDTRAAEIWAAMTEAVETRDRIVAGARPISRDADPFDLRLALFPLTDLGNAERFVERNRLRYLWCNELGWAWWDGTRWSFDDGDAHVLLAVHGTVRAIQAEARALQSSDRDVLISEATERKPEVWLHDKVAQWGRSSENRPRLNAIAEQARPMMAARPQDLDADPLKLNVLNGTLHCRRPEECADDEDLIVLRPHDPADRITKLAPVIFDPDAPRPIFDQFFNTVQPDVGRQRFLRSYAGYSATGLTTEQKLVFNYGRGKNGKSTYVDALAHVLGDYEQTVGIETFLDQGTKRKGSDASPDMAALKGARMVRTSEPEKGSTIAEALIKLVTGGEPLKVRFLNKDFFTLQPEFKLTISGNYRPQIKGTDEGIWRRMVLVPWLFDIPSEDIDRSLSLKMRAEASGILNFILDGMRDWLENGLIIPDTIQEATQAYRRDSDPLGQFLTLCAVDEAGWREQSSKFYGVFHAWAKWAGERDWTQTGFSRAMKDRGYRTVQNNVIWWRDVRLLKTVEDFDSPPPDHQPRSSDDEGSEK